MEGHEPGRSMVPHDAVAMVISRAAELEHHGRAIPGGGLDERAVVDIGREVGLTPAAVREALDEYQAGLLQTAGAKQQTVVGPRLLVVERTLPAALPGVDAQVQAFLHRKLFECCRRVGSRSMWRPREGLLATIQRAGKRLGSERTVDDVTEVTVSLADALDQDGRAAGVHVRFEIECRVLRRGLVATAVGGTAASGTGAVAATGAAIALGEPLALLGLPVLGGLAAGAYLGPRHVYRRKLEDVALVFEGCLDELVRPGSAVESADDRTS